jgi:hypothetical protein
LSAILDTLAEIGGPEMKSRYASAKKGDIAAAAEKICAGTAIVEASIRAVALAWVPAEIQFASAVTDGEACISGIGQVAVINADQIATAEVNYDHIADREDFEMSEPQIIASDSAGICLGDDGGKLEKAA